MGQASHGQAKRHTRGNRSNTCLAAFAASVGRRRFHDLDQEGRGHGLVETLEDDVAESSTKFLLFNIAEG